MLHARGSALAAGALLALSLLPAPTTAAELIRIQVFPNGSISPGSGFGFGAIGTYSDGTGRDITREVRFVSSKPAVASVGKKNVVNGLMPGTSEISAVRGSLVSTRNATLSVSPVASLEIEPGENGIRLGSRVRWAASATLEDGAGGLTFTNRVSWSSADPSIVEIGNRKKDKGLAEGVALGTTMIEATLPATVTTSEVTVTKEITVVEVLQSVAVTPPSRLVQPRSPGRFRALGLFEGGVVADISFDVGWISSDPSIARLDKSGRPKIRALGMVDLSAVDRETSLGSSDTGGDATLEIVGDVITLTVEPATLELAVGEEERFDVTATVVADDPSGEKTIPGWGGRVTWLSTNPSKATVSDDGDVRCVASEPPGPVTIFVIDEGTGTTSSDPNGGNGVVTCL